MDDSADWKPATQPLEDDTSMVWSTVAKFIDNVRALGNDGDEGCQVKVSALVLVDRRRASRSLGIRLLKRFRRAEIWDWPGRNVLHCRHPLRLAVQ